jgi:alpha-beta hydrolase superfamily lysophospholipase
MESTDQRKGEKVTHTVKRRSFNGGRAAILAAALSLGAALSATAMPAPLYAHFLFLPRRAIRSVPEEIAGVACQSVTIDIGKKHLGGWFFEKAGAPYVVLVSHGNGGNVSSVRWIAKNLLSTGVSVLLYDYRNYGTSSRGTLTVKSICEDGDAAYDYLVQKKNYKPENIILYGQSLGCAVACNISKDRQAAGLILQSGFSSLRHVAFEHFPVLHGMPILVPDALDNRKILSHSKLPVLFIHGDKDRMVPFDNAQILYEAASGPKWLVVCHDAGHHLYPKSDAEHLCAVREFIDRIRQNNAHQNARENAAKVSQSVTAYRWLYQ